MKFKSAAHLVCRTHKTRAYAASLIFIDDASLFYPPGPLMFRVLAAPFKCDANQSGEVLKRANKLTASLIARRRSIRARRRVGGGRPIVMVLIWTKQAAHDHREGESCSRVGGSVSRTAASVGVGGGYLWLLVHQSRRKRWRRANRFTSNPTSRGVFKQKQKQNLQNSGGPDKKKKVSKFRNILRRWLCEQRMAYHPVKLICNTSFIITRHLPLT